MAEGFSQNPTQYIERLLECAVCLERFWSPKLLPCQHTFCRGCLLQLIQAKEGKTAPSIRCPTCRVLHRVPPAGVDSFPNNLTITALLDIPKASQSSTASPTDNEVPTTSKSHQQKDGPEVEADSCTVCQTVGKVVLCFHCDKRVCMKCRDSHKKSVQQEVIAHLDEVKQKSVLLATSLQIVKQQHTTMRHEILSLKRDVWETIESVCKDLRDKGNLITTQMDLTLEQKLQDLRTQQEKIELYVASMESFNNYTLSKMKGPIRNIQDSDMVSAMKQCSQYTKKPFEVNVSVKSKKRSTTPTKNKRRSCSGVRAIPDRPSMRRLQSLPLLDDALPDTAKSSPPPIVSGLSPSDSSVPNMDIEPARSPGIMANVGHRDSLDENAAGSNQVTVSQSQTCFIVGDQENADQCIPNTFDAMDITERDIPVSNEMSMNLLDTTNTGRALNSSQMSNHSYGGIIVRATIGKQLGSRFWNPSAICISPLNATMIVLDSYKNCVQVLDRDGHFVTSFGSSGSGDGKFDYPNACACTKEGRIMVSDAFNHRVQIFDKYGLFLSKFGYLGTEKGCLESPSGVAIDQNGYIYIADTNNCRIQVYDQMGGVVHMFGAPSSLPANLEQPRYSAITISASGDVFISDSKNHCIHVFTYCGEYHKSIGRQGKGLGEFSSPRGLAIDLHDQLFVADRDNHRVQVFTQHGDFIYSFGSQGESIGQFHGPEGVAVADNGDIVVAECGGQRIQIFSLVPTTE